MEDAGLLERERDAVPGSWIQQALWVLRERDRVFGEIVENREVGTKIGIFLAMAAVLMGAYGLSMGLFNGWTQAAVSMAKVPCLFLLTLFICYPALFVINSLLGSQIGFLQTMALLLASFSFTGILLAAFAPISVFFVLTGGDYAFMKLLHVSVMGIAAAGGFLTMYRGLVFVCERHDVYPKLAMRTFRVWLMVFAFVGTQMAWTLRPFVGSRDLPFEVFRSRKEGNFYKAVLQAMKDLD